MAYKRKKNKGESPKLDMTPMIDVVFQLLIFFVVTLKQEDILSKLSAARPAANPDEKVKEQQQDLINVIVAPQGFVFNGRPMRLPELDRSIERLSGYSKTAMVIIKCYADSTHAMLIQVLDVCNKHGMTNLSIFSM
ncbi:MAG TPA: biopolymer transporter ExbD [Kiritimatiellia bacterium]|jgi:biopolymer transport protein ExbD|nr:biopolymer transporter ExbD [Kiritimatiellia bacterium]HOR97957.1 biopolymer transporter ExbD [Kiritimatiellia bacterium]HPK37542.1 biopolymer transporter ExbD [Kiritimatiellia bacterium]HRU19891.1 biopolymer transporter ExbD [Kiritimatiellia bacterium]